MGKEGNQLVLRDTRGHAVKTPIEDLNIVTTIKEIESGKYEFTNEKREKSIIDVTGSVIENITEILLNEEVTKEIYEKIAADGKAATPKDTSIQIDNGEQAVLNPMQISVAKAGITPDKIKPGSNGTFLITSNTGEVKWVSATDESIKEILSLNQAITLLRDNGDGTLTYYNESCFDKDGKFIVGSKGSTFDSNTLRIVATTDGKYKFYDGRSKDVPVETIDVVGTVVDNITEILNKEEITKEIYEKIAAEGKAATPKDTSIQIDNGGKAVLNPMQISVAKEGITTDKIKPGVVKQLLVTDKAGKVNWVDASDDIIKEAVKLNEKVTVLRDNNNGTFTYFSEDAIDSKTGSLIESNGIKFDANTLHIVERKGEKEKGIYDFYDGLTSLNNPLITISTRANSIYFDNSTSIGGDNLQVVIDNIIEKIEIAQGKPADLKGDGISINGDTVLAGAVLKAAMLTITDGAVTDAKIGVGAVTTDKLRDEAVQTKKIKNAAVTPAKIEPGADKYLLVTKGNKVEWVPATDSIIKEVVKTNEVVTVLEDNNNGTYSYYNEEAIDSDGNFIPSKAQIIDANTLSITLNDKGGYVFADGNGVIDTIDIKATVINNIDEILNDSNVQNSIYNTVAAKGKELKGDKAIQVTNGKKAVLSEVSLSLNNNSIGAEKLEAGANKTFLVTTNTGEVKWVSADDKEVEDILKLKETVTLLDVSQKGKGIYTYYNEEAVKNNTIGVEIDVNSLTIDSSKPGVFVFKDLSSDNPLATIDIPQEVINNVSVILNDTNVQNQINNIIKANAKDLSSADSSIVVQTGEGAVLENTKISIAEKGVDTSKLADAGVTPIKIAPGATKTFLVTTSTGEVKWIDANDKQLEDILKLKETVTVLEDLGTGKFVYKNEIDIKEGKPGIVFDANTLTIKEEVKGIYSFYDKTSSTDPIAKVDVPASVISNINTILNDPKVRIEISNIIEAKAQAVESTDKSIAITGGDKAVLSHLTLNIAEGGVTTNKISSKVEGVDAPKGTILTAAGDGKVGFETATETIKPAMRGDLVGEENVINITGGRDVLYGQDGKEVTISINTGGITSSHIQNETIVNDDIAPQTIKGDRLDTKGETLGHVATVNANGSVSYQALSASSIANKGKITVKDGISVSDGADKVLADVTLGLTDGKVAPTKLIASTTDKYLLATKEGKAQWIPATDAIIDDAVKQNETVTILKNKGKGVFTYYNEKEIDEKGEPKGAGVSFDLNSLSIDSSKPGVYIFKDLSSDTPLATIDIEKDVINSIVTILGDINVKEEVYNIVASQGKAIISDGSLDIPVNKAGLEGVELKIASGGVKTAHIDTNAVTTTKIADKQVTAAKLVADGTLSGHVATVNADGTVSYKPLTSSEVSGNAAALKTDGIILVGGVSEQVGTLFKDATLSIKSKGINTDQLADGAVTNGQIATRAVTVDKISAGNEPPKRVMVIGEDGVVKWGELDDIVTDAAGNLTSSDNIIAIKGTSGPVTEYGENALFKDVVLSVNDNSITKDKLSSALQTGGNEVEDMLLATDGKGGFYYVEKEAVQAGGEDLTLGTALEFINNTDGKLAALAPTSIDIKNKGVGTTKLADQAVTIEKISSVVDANNATENSVLTAKGDGTVEYKRINSNAFEGAEANLLSDGSLTIPEDNKAVLKEVKIGVADEGVKTKHIDNDAVTTVKIANEQVTAEKIKGGAPKQLLITNNGAKAEWVDASNLIIKEIVNSNETITLLTDKGNGTFIYQNEEDIKEGNEGVLFDANTLKIDKSKPGIYVFTDGKGELATINVSEDVINSITNILEDTNVKEEIYNIIASQGQKVSTDDAIGVVGGDKATLTPMTISLNDGGVTTKKITSKVDGNSSDKGTVLTADGEGNVIFQKLDEIALTQGQAITSKDGSLSIPVGNKATLQEIDMTVAIGGIKNVHIAEKEVTVDKIKASEPAGKVLTSDGKGGAGFKALGEVVGNSGKEIIGDSAIAVEGGEQAALTEVSLSLNNNSITEVKLATDAVTTGKIKNNSVTANKMAGEIKETILITDNSGTVKWADANNTVIGDIVRHTESVTVLRDNNDGTFTYFNENEVDNKGNIKDKAKGVTFDANTITVDSTTTPGVYVFKDHEGKNTLTTIDTRASKIIFEGDVIYNNVEEALTEIIEKINILETGEIPKASLSGTGILVNGNSSEADAVLKKVELSIADSAITTSKILDENVTATKIKGGEAKQLLVTNDQGKTVWVDASDDIIKEIVDSNETVTVLTDLGNGKFSYQSEADIKAGQEGIIFDANTLEIKVVGKGKYEFYDRSKQEPLETIDVAHDVIENILEIVNNVSVKEEIFNIIAEQGKDVSGDNSIDIIDGDKAALKAMTISLKKDGVTNEKIKNLAVTENKLFAGEGKTNYIPVVQGDGTVKYQPMTTVVTGKMLSVNESLEITGEGDASKALLQELGLQVKEGGIGNEHIKSLAVTSDKISSKSPSGNHEKGDILVADGSGNTVFVQSKEIVNIATQGDLIGEKDVLLIEGGENVLFGDEKKKVNISINKGGINGGHIAADAIRDLNIVNQTISASKLNGGSAVEGSVATVGKNGVVSYQALTPSTITGKGTISVTDGLTVDNGADKVFANVTLGIANTSIGVNKLDGGEAAPGSVAMVSSNGKSVTYEVLTTDKLGHKGNIKTDGAITASDNGVGKVLADVTLGINDLGIKTQHIANDAVKNEQIADLAITANKISSKGIEAKSVLISGSEDNVFWGELKDIVTNTAGNLELDNDGILTFEKGTGENTLLADVKLGVAPQSITVDKLNSTANGVKEGDGMLLVADGQGGFRFKKAEDASVVTKNLTLGSALTFTNGSTGIDAVLDTTSFDVAAGGIDTTKLKEGAVTVEKMSSGNALPNTVLTAKGDGKVAYEILNENVFNGKGANLLTDTSIKVEAGNQALLKETTIAIAESGVKTIHIDNKSVTAAKISPEASATGTVLTVDSKGNAAFQALNEVSKTQGKAMTSSDGSLVVTDNNKAALQDVNIVIAKDGVREGHIASKQVTTAKIGTGDLADGLLLTSNGQGGAEFRNVGEALLKVGKELKGGNGITISGSGKDHALIDDATINITQGGIDEIKLADNAVTTIKIADKNVTAEKLGSKKDKDSNVPKGQVLTADGLGGVKFETVATQSIPKADLTGQGPIKVSNGKDAVLTAVTLDINDGSIKGSHIGERTIMNANIGKNQIDREHIYPKNIDEAHLNHLAVSTRTIQDEAVTGAKIADGAVKNAKLGEKSVQEKNLDINAVSTRTIVDKAVIVDKIGAGTATVGHVLTVESGGKVAFKAPTGSSVTKKNIAKSSTIQATKGATGSVMEEVQLDIIAESIGGEHIKYNTIGYKNMASNAIDNAQLRAGAVYGRAVSNQGISAEKIDSDGVKGGFVLMSDGDGGASWEEVKTSNEVKAALPKFFYAPSFYITVEPGDSDEIDVYEYYKTQFGTPKTVNKNAQKKSLPVLAYDELDYYVLYYDEDVFETVEISDYGDLKYKVKRDAQVGTNTYFNIVFGVRD
ncbi:hypothetical protein [Myroides sp.]|uniref:hypothetical protein n=1 Tax=Myroides sp. TaxID=1874736 RepID=UPI003F3B2E61